MSDVTESADIAAGFLRYLDGSEKRHLLPQVVALLQKEVAPDLPELSVESASALNDSDRNEILKSLAGKPHAGEICNLRPCHS